MATSDTDIVAYDLPLTADGDRTFSCSLGPNTFAFRSYYVTAGEAHWYLDVFDAQYNPLAIGRKLVIGSINMLKGYSNTLDQVAVVVYPAEGVTDPTEVLGSSLRVMWFPASSENPLTDGDPMNYLYENFNIAQ